ncbi:histidine kinase dimerization/phosphoacceptor domain -containing protein [Acuticoccus mangrovi]|uniref:GAF domain-containing protein n=1 Tax=Acuticoccus mangrovi TaxID=2796142 RepID=A0A934IPA5_9HYPH|nr:GAF domain-containing protein [Acuticoccus mangrovi]
MTFSHNASAQSRVAAITAYGILDTPRERAFDEIAELVAAICETPMAAVSLIDQERQWFKAEVGLGVRETPLSQSICVTALDSDDVIEIEDTLEDPRSCANTLCSGPAALRFYAGAVLRTPSGVPFGTLCVLDTKPRKLTDLQRTTIRVLARQVTKELDLRQALKRQEVMQHEVDHRVKNSLQSVASFIRLQSGRAQEEATREVLETVGRRISSVALLHQELYAASVGEEVALNSYMEKLGRLFAASAPEGVRLETRCETALVSAEQATALAAICNEFVANSFKHAFPDGREGIVSIIGARGADGVFEVHLEDDGVGVDPAAAGRGLGMRIIDASAQQMGAQLAFPGRAAGHGLTLVFPTIDVPPSVPVTPAMAALEADAPRANHGGAVPRYHAPSR